MEQEFLLQLFVFRDQPTVVVIQTVIADLLGRIVGSVNHADEILVLNQDDPLIVFEYSPIHFSSVGRGSGP